MTSQFPGPAERTRLNDQLHTHGTDTGWHDDNGRPAPWPDDIAEWRPITGDDNHAPFDF